MSGTIPPGNNAAHVADLRLAKDALSGIQAARAAIAVRFECIPRILTDRNKRFGGHLNGTDLADLSQDSATTAWARLDTFEGRAALETWVYRICTLELMNAVRRKQRQKMRTAGSAADTDLAWLPNTQNQPVNPIRFEGLYQCFELLGQDEERILRFKHYDDLTFEAIGKLLGKSTSGAKHQYYKALLRLKGLMSAGKTASEHES